MHKITLFLITSLLSGMVFSADIERGQTVVDIHDSPARKIQKILAISSDDGLIQLEDRSWYDAQYIKPLVQSYGQFRTNQLVVNTSINPRKIQNILNIECDGIVQLDDGAWYDASYLKPILKSFNDFYLGETIAETYHTPRIIRQISNFDSEGLIQLDDGIWYDPSYIRRLAKSFAGYDLNQRVVDVYDNPRQIKKIINLERDGLVQLEDQTWYDPTYIKPLAKKFGHFFLKQMVVDTYHSPRQIKSVLNIEADGVIQLSDSVWYDSSYLHPLVSVYKGITLGQSVVEIYHSDATQKPKTVLSIEDDGIFLLDDGSWYDRSYIQLPGCKDQCR